MLNNCTVQNNKFNYYQVQMKNSDGKMICIDDADCSYLTSLFNFESNDDIADILVYCLMPDSVQLLVGCEGAAGVNNLLNKITTGYSQYFFDKYSINNFIKDNNCRVSPILSFDELLDVSRQIHIAHKQWLHYPHSSLRAYLYNDTPDFINRSHIANIYGSAVEYFEFLSK